MFAVPEVDDNIDASSPTETIKPLSQQLEETMESLPSPPTSISTKEKEEKIQVTTQLPPTEASKQHISRLSHFQRNTIHLCDQIADHV